MLSKRVVLVDDHPLYRAGVRRVLEASGRYTVAGEAGCAHEAIRATETTPVLPGDVVKVDVNLPATQ